jgi:hypothetical protein
MLCCCAILLLGIKILLQQYRRSVIQCKALNIVFQKLSGHSRSLLQIHDVFMAQVPVFVLNEKAILQNDLQPLLNLSKSTFGKNETRPML